MFVVMKGVAVRNLRIDAPDGKVHLGKPPGRVVRLLAVNGDVAELAAVGLDKLLTTDEHAARSATWVIDTALVGRKHFNQHAHDAGWRIELPALLALCTGEL